MDGFQWNNTPDSKSRHGMVHQQLYQVIPAWDEILDAPTLHQQEDYQLVPQQFQNNLQHQNLQSTQHCVLYPPGQMPLSEDQLYFQNQLCSQHLEHQNLQSMQSSSLCPPEQLHPSNGQESIQNQLSPYHFQHPNLQSTELSVLCPPGQLHPTEDQVSFENQGHLQKRGMIYDISQHPVMQQEFQQHTQEQTYQQLQAQASLHPIPTSLSHTSMFTNTPPPSKPRPQKPRKHVDHKPTEPNPDQTWKEEMREFVNTFKKRRKLLGLSQKAVGLELGKLCEEEIKKDRVFLFEKVRLRFQDMCDFKQLLERWMENIETSLRNAYSSEDAPEFPIPNLTYDSSISSNARKVLRKAFKENPNPRVEEIEKLAKSLDLDKLSVTIWFYERRQIIKLCSPQTGC